MEIEAEVTLTDIVKIKVNGADALAAIMEEPDSVRNVCRGVNQLAAFMRAIDDDLIQQMNPAQRVVVAKFLLEQYKRYTGSGDEALKEYQECTGNAPDT